MQVRKQRLELDMEQETGSKLGKEYVKAVYCHPAYLTYMQSTSWELLDWMKHKLESSLPGEISVTSDIQMTPPLWVHCEESWVQKNWCFWTVVLEKTLESPLDSKEIRPVYPKGNQSWISIGRIDAEAETPILGHLMRRTDSFEKTLMLGKIEGRRRGREDVIKKLGILLTKMITKW